MSNRKKKLSEKVLNNSKLVLCNKLKNTPSKSKNINRKVKILSEKHTKTQKNDSKEQKKLSEGIILPKESKESVNMEKKKKTKFDVKNVTKISILFLGMIFLIVLIN